MIVPFTDDVDLGGRGKRIGSIFGSSIGTANTVRIRRASLTGAICFEFQVPINSSKEITFSALPYVAEGIFVEVAPGTAFSGSIDVI